METCTIIAFVLASVGITPGDCDGRAHYVAVPGTQGAIVEQMPHSRCPVCRALGQRSLVFPGACFTTLMGAVQYYDEQGNYHYSDPNVTTCELRCDHGHSWSEQSGGSR